MMATVHYAPCRRYDDRGFPTELVGPVGFCRAETRKLRKVVRPASAAGLIVPFGVVRMTILIASSQSSICSSTTLSEVSRETLVAASAIGFRGCRDLLVGIQEAITDRFSATWAIHDPNVTASLLGDGQGRGGKRRRRCHCRPHVTPSATSAVCRRIHRPSIGTCWTRDARVSRDHVVNPRLESAQFLR